MNRGHVPANASNAESLAVLSASDVSASLGEIEAMANNAAAGPPSNSLPAQRYLQNAMSVLPSSTHRTFPQQQYQQHHHQPHATNLVPNGTNGAFPIPTSAQPPSPQFSDHQRNFFNSGQQQQPAMIGHNSTYSNDATALFRQSLARAQASTVMHGNNGAVGAPVQSFRPNVGEVASFGNTGATGNESAHNVWLQYCEKYMIEVLNHYIHSSCP
jgi:hypothetical protein